MDSVKFLLRTIIPSGNCKNHLIQMLASLITRSSTNKDGNKYVCKEEEMIWQLLVFIRFTGSLKTHTLSPHYNFLWWVSTNISELLLFVDHPAWPGGLRSGESRCPGNFKVMQFHRFMIGLSFCSFTKWYIVTEKCQKMTQQSLSLKSDKLSSLQKFEGFSHQEAFTHIHTQLCTYGLQIIRW